MAEDHANPHFVAMALLGYGLAYSESDPAHALDTLDQGLAYAHDHRQRFWETLLARAAARLEAAHGDLDRAFMLYDNAIDAFHQSGDVSNLAITLGYLASTFHRLQDTGVAAVLYGTTTRATTPLRGFAADLPDRLRARLGDPVFERCVATGAAMAPAEAVRYARDRILAARSGLTSSL